MPGLKSTVLAKQRDVTDITPEPTDHGYRTDMGSRTRSATAFVASR
jgi:hypothetical protein